jgi:phosphoribosylanthranilate isomerase
LIRVKICSVQESEHILAAAEAGADFVGLNFVPGVRRRLSADKVKTVVKAYRAKSSSGPKLVGIFVDQPIEEVNRILDECELDMAQLSGHESFDYCSLVCRTVIKAVHVPMGQPNEGVLTYLDSIISKLNGMDVIPLLHPDVGTDLGGTGRSFDWSIASALAKRYPLILAGGLSPENVARAVRDVCPWGVDVSSGVETDNIKDISKMMEFVQQAKGTGL